MSKIAETADGGAASPERHVYSPGSGAQSVENVLRILEGRWKLVILFRLFGGKRLRFSELERAIPGISQKMLIQQLRQLESDGVVARIVHHEVPPRVEYHLTEWGQSLCPALDELLKWAESAPQDIRDKLIGPEAAGVPPNPPAQGEEAGA